MKPKFAEFRLLFPRNVDESGEKEEERKRERGGFIKDMQALAQVI